MLNPLNFSDKPSPPQGPLEVCGMTESSCTISWSPPAYDGGTPLLDYTVSRKEANKKAWVQLATVTETSLFMGDLAYNNAYVFKITARNMEGHSEPYISEDPIVAGRKISELINIDFVLLIVLEKTKQYVYKQSPRLF